MNKAADKIARASLGALEGRIKATAPQLPDKLWKLEGDLRRILQQGCKSGLLRQAFREIDSLYRSKKPNEREIAPEKRGAVVIMGGDRSEEWEEARQFERDDGARFNFSVTVRYEADGGRPHDPELLAYHFNLAFPAGHQPAFIRFDLNEADFADDPSRDLLKSPLLCHAHPGHGDMTVPTLVLSPREMLHLILRGHLRGTSG